MSDKKVDYSEFREEAEEVLDLEEESSEQRRKREEGPLPILKVTGVGKEVKVEFQPDTMEQNKELSKLLRERRLFKLEQAATLCRLTHSRARVLRLDGAYLAHIYEDGSTSL